MTEATAYVIWRQPYHDEPLLGGMGVATGATEGEVRARLAVELGPTTEVVEVHDDWTVALGRYATLAAGLDAQHDPDPTCSCAPCRAHVMSTCRHWRTRDALGTYEVRWCLDCDTIVNHVVVDVPIEVDGAQRTVLAKRSTLDADGPVELRLPDGRSFFVNRLDDVVPVATDLLAGTGTG